jgi:phosphoribosyl 1,2-cyclic phosphate phosphodiesterase
LLKKQLKIYFLGTGTSQGIPIIGSNHPVCLSSNPKDKRLRVSVLISWENYNFVIDCGPDFRQQMLASNCQKLDGILYTHEHADHTAGLDDVRPFYFKQAAIAIFAHKRVLADLKKRFAYIFQEKNRYPGVPEITTTEIKNNQNFTIGNKTAIAVNAKHGNLQVFGYRIDDFAYLTDVKTIAKVEINKLTNLKVLVINALRNEPHNTHFSLQEALDFIKIIQPKKAFITHISHMLGFHDEVSQKLPQNVYLAYDNLEIKL